MRKGFFCKLAASNIRKHRKVYYPYMLTAVLTVMMLYIVTSMAENPSLRDGNLIFTLTLGKWVTTLFTVVFLFYTNSFLMKRRKMEFGLLNILGMEKKHISLVVCYETLIILLFSLAVGMGLGTLLDRLLYTLLIRLLGRETIGMSYYVSPSAMLSAGTVVAVTFGVILLNSIRQIHLSKPIELLRGGQVGEKEPKANWFLAALGALLLGGGYYISVRVNNVVASIFLFFIAVVMVILGTYLLYTSGSVTLLKALRRNKRYYYQPSHFINVSGMIYRMKQNAVGLANISVLSTMVLVTVFAVCSLWFGMEAIIRDRCPRDICLTGRSPEYRREILALSQEIANEQGLMIIDESDFESVSFAAYLQDGRYITDTSAVPEMEALLGDGLTYVIVIGLDDYNRMTGEAEALAENEILLSSLPYAQGDALELFGNAYPVKRTFQSSALDNQLKRVSVYQCQWLVVRDRAAFDEMNRLQAETYGRYASHPQLEYSFSLSGADDETVDRFSDRFLEALKEKELGTFYLDDRVRTATDTRQLYGGLLFVGLFVGLLFLMAMILIVYYKQISEGYDDKERYHIMRKVGLSRKEIKASIRSQTLLVFFLPLATAGVHTAFSFPSLTRMFYALSMTDVGLMGWCLLGSFLLFVLLYLAVYEITAKVYYKIVG